MPQVKAVEHGNGDVSIGFESNGVYVPAVTVPAHRIEHYRERAATLAERLDADPNDAEAQAAVESVPVSAKSEAKPEKGGGS